MNPFSLSLSKVFLVITVMLYFTALKAQDDGILFVNKTCSPVEVVASCGTCETNPSYTSSVNVTIPAYSAELFENGVSSFTTCTGDFAYFRFSFPLSPQGHDICFGSGIQECVANPDCTAFGCSDFIVVAQNEANCFQNDIKVITTYQPGSQAGSTCQIVAYE